MKKNITKWLILLTVLSPLSLQAQGWLSGAPWTQSSPAVTMGVDANGTLVATAPINTSLTFNSTETGTTNPQLLWVPALGAFRAGFFGFAPSTTTMGEYSTAFGYGSAATGSNSVAFSGGAATGVNGVAFSQGYAAGPYSIAFGGGMGATAIASGEYSTAIGPVTTATGTGAFACGVDTYAGGATSASFNGGTQANGDYSAAFNLDTIAGAYASFAIGRYNLGSYGTSGNTTWISTDPLFEIGNGTSSSAKSDALVVYKNGNAAFQGTVTAAAGGDIPMFTGY